MKSGGLSRQRGETAPFPSGGNEEGPSAGDQAISGPSYFLTSLGV